MTNAGLIQGYEDGVIIMNGTGDVTNSASIIATYDDGVALFDGGSVANAAGALISAEGASGHAAGVFITSGSGSLTNAGTINGSTFGALITYGSGTVTNAGTISGSTAGVSFNEGAGTLTNAGTITGTGANDAGADLETGGSVTNAAGALISGSAFGVFITGGSGTVENAGTISGGTYSVEFANPGTNLLKVDPGAVFNGPVNFDGTLEVAGSVLDSIPQMRFLNSSELAIDNIGAFGTNIGNPDLYSGPLLDNFRVGDTIDLRDFASAGVLPNPPTVTPTGILQISNGLEQVADLAFQPSTLGPGTFQATSDGSTGTLLTLQA